MFLFWKLLSRCSSISDTTSYLRVLEDLSLCVDPSPLKDSLIDLEERKGKMKLYIHYEGVPDFTLSVNWTNPKGTFGELRQVLTSKLVLNICQLK